MIVTLVQFHVDPLLSMAEATAKFSQTAPNYRGLKAMVRKEYIYGGNGKIVGGILIWNSKQAAEAWFNDDWRARVTKHYGVAPSMAWFEAPLTIDNTQMKAAS